MKGLGNIDTYVLGRKKLSIRKRDINRFGLN
jgi:hypothetical protein